MFETNDAADRSDPDFPSVTIAPIGLLDNGIVT